MVNNASMKFKDWVNIQRGRSLAVARHLGVTQPVVSDWVSEKKAIPALHCRAILDFSAGAVTCQEMRPTDWHKYWPELAQVPANQAQPATESVAQGV